MAFLGLVTYSFAANHAIQVSDNFPSGSIGKATQLSGTELVLALKHDNNDASLPARFRNWWYVKLDNVPINQPLNIHVQNLGWSEFYVPVYSYDQQHWYHFEESDVSITNNCSADIARCRLTISHSFEKDTVYIARFYPYPYERLQAYLAKMRASPYLYREILGESSVLHLPIELLSVTDSSVADRDKTRIWIQARTHPAETGSSFVLEGLLNFLLSEDESAQAIRKHFIFNIIPMHNPDGVQAGNYRVSMTGVELERAWQLDATHPARLLESMPQENHILNEKMRAWLNNDGNAPPISIAINLHSTVTQPEVPAFFFTHFGADPNRYNVPERSLYYKQVQLINLVGRYYQSLQGGIVQPPSEGGRSFLNDPLPETWWWTNKQDEVLAITLETVYGKAGFEHWVEEDDMRQLGKALGLAITCYDSQVC